MERIGSRLLQGDQPLVDDILSIIIVNSHNDSASFLDRIVTFSLIMKQICCMIFIHRFHLVVPFAAKSNLLPPSLRRVGAAMCSRWSTSPNTLHILVFDGATQAGGSPVVYRVDRDPLDASYGIAATDRGCNGTYCCRDNQNNPRLHERTTFVAGSGAADNLSTAKVSRRRD